MGTEAGDDPCASERAVEGQEYEVCGTCAYVCTHRVPFTRYNTLLLAWSSYQPDSDLTSE